ncbi:dihydrolipoyllysine-residue acetyltransferase [Aestuariibacter salexigens]|uniref:dihydrolipoyllysine-residue acetyltransferase n=1 Tax=Aestuariibacter salexigens TaxID=226010 RepID=UPI00042A418A|nr:dihydrolipoyllysine-residue acetyltransferase [Aestuariibacter salexigens]
MTDFILPDIGEGIVECELIEWLVEEGQQIQEDQPVAEVMTDKATVQIPAMHSGVVKKLYYKVGDIAKVHEPLFAMEIDGNASAEQQAESSEALAAAANAPASNDAIDFILPDIGEGIVECELIKWLVDEGEQVAEDQAVVEVMTDKAVVEIPSKYAGTIGKHYYRQGDIAKVHTPLFSIYTDDANNSEQVAEKPSSAQNKAPVSLEDSNPFDAGQFEPPVVIPGKVLASPAVRRIAREQNIDLSAVKGSGKKGRILKQDVLENAPSGAAQPHATAQKATQKVAVSSSGTRTEPIKGMKAAMAKQMTKSVFTIPHFSVSDEVNMNALIALRAQLKPEFEKQGVKLSYMPFIVKALSLALTKFPVINSQVNDDCTEITYFDDHNIGMAVDSKVGLLVPNIKQVQNKSIFEIAQDIGRLTELGREGRLSSDDLKGGTISISNIGVIGGTVATPVINAPESAIVALGKIQRLPRFDDNDNVVAANIMHISWSGDHRIIDGATMVRFSNLWRSYLENPVTMLTALR